MSTDTMDRSTNGTSTSSGQRPERLQDAASGIIDQASRTASSQASRTMSRAGDTLEQVARAVRESGSQMRQERPEIAGVADTVATRVEQASTYLREHDAQEVRAEAERFARRQPALVVAGGLVAGLVIGRLLRSGAEPGMSHDRRQLATNPTSDWRQASVGTTSPGSGYGTGFGASQAQATGGIDAVVGDSLAATDLAARGDTGGASGLVGAVPASQRAARASTRASSTAGSSTTKRRARSTGSE
jgi:ElaB/YqjD/DUF883 family membrane-anchored ribosome-binding protein